LAKKAIMAVKNRRCPGWLTKKAIMAVSLIEHTVLYS